MKRKPHYFPFTKKEWFEVCEKAAIEAHALEIKNFDAIDAIQKLMDEKGLTRKDLFPFKSRASEYMKRKRPLSMAIIRKLHFEYGIPAEILIAPYRKPIVEDYEDD